MPPHRSANRSAIMLMIVSMSFLAANDAVTKHVGAWLPTGQIMVIRGFFLCAFLALSCRLGGQQVNFSDLLHRWSLVRGLSEVGAAYLFISSLALVPIALASTLVLCFPIILTAISGPLLGERVGPWRWCAVLTGFVGVLIVTAPGGESWSPALALPLGAAAFVAVRDISTRFVASHVSSGSVTLTSALVVTVGGFASLPFGWAEPTASDVSWLALSGAFMTITFLAHVTAIRRGELSLLAPVQYVIILWALLFGLVFWNETPGPRELLGGGVIVASGLLILHREKVRYERMTGRRK